MLTWIVLAVACVSWTITKEEVFREFREWCQKWEQCNFLTRKLAYLPTCYYCTSHYVSAAVLLWTGYTLPAGWLVTWFTTVILANVVLTVFNMLRAALRGIQGWADEQTS